MKSLPHLHYEEKYWQDSCEVAGIDEVGRGCLAGPLVASCVIFSKNLSKDRKNNLLLLGINDSKKLTAKKREYLVEEIKRYAFFYTTIFIDPNYINIAGISQSLSSAVEKLIDSCIQYCHKNQISFLIDGLPISHIPYSDEVKKEFIVKGDSQSISVAAASILAKVTRDAYMKDLSKTYPGYGWEENKGYGTKNHIKAIKTYGITPHHRLLFVRNIIE